MTAEVSGSTHGLIPSATPLLKKCGGKGLEIGGRGWDTWVLVRPILLCDFGQAAASGEWEVGLCGGLVLSGPSNGVPVE